MSLGTAPGTGRVAELHRGHYWPLVRLAAILIDDVGTCEELVQDSFVAVLARPPALADDTRLPAYLRSAVLNGARSHLRRRTRERARPLSVVRAGPSAEADALEATEHDAVQA